MGILVVNITPRIPEYLLSLRRSHFDCSPTLPAANHLPTWPAKAPMTFSPSLTSWEWKTSKEQQQVRNRSLLRKTKPNRRRKKLDRRTRMYLQISRRNWPPNRRALGLARRE